MKQRSSFGSVRRLLWDERLKFSDKSGHIFSRGKPHERPVDLVVTVNQSISHPSYLPPGNAGSSLEKTIGEAANGFANNRQLTDHCPSLLFHRGEIRFVGARNKSCDAPPSEHNV